MSGIPAMRFPGRRLSAGLVVTLLLAVGPPPTTRDGPVVDGGRQWLPPLAACSAYRPASAAQPNPDASGFVAGAAGATTGRPEADSAAPPPDESVGQPGDQTVQPWRHPVDAPIVDGFGPPTTPYGPGNRGLEYGTVRGDPIVATADGTVTFAGSVGRSKHIVVRHPSGIRSTYSFLQRIDTAVGRSVTGGEPIATAEPGFHLTARLGNTYLDPLSLMVDACFLVHLVPIPPRTARR